MQASLRRTTIRIVPLALVSATASANHGPGTSGGGSSTISGETLKSGRFDVSLRTDWTRFESFTRAQAEQRALASGEFDALDESIVQSVSIAYGLADDLQLGATVGYYWGMNFIDAEADGMGGAESSIADPRGLTDLWLSGKWRFAHGQSGQFAAVFGVKLPTGKDDERLENGELLEPSSQPGTGAVDGQLGLAFSRYLSSRVTVDASALYTLRGEHDDFRVGDRTDLGAALAYRLTEDVQAFPNWSVSGEVLGVILGKDDDGGDTNPNSGGTTIYLAPGARSRLSDNVSLGLATAFPISQDLNGDQVETRAKAAFTLSFAF